MVEYVTKGEVIDLLTDEFKEVAREGNKEESAVLKRVIRRVNMMDSMRPPLPARWKTMGSRKETIFCGGCGFQTLAYKRSKYCPNCGRPMLNGVPNDVR